MRAARLPGVLGCGRDWYDLLDLATRAAREFAELGGRAQKSSRLRTVLLSGDVYVRLDDFGGDGLSRRLNDLGLKVLVEPASVLAEYLVLERSPQIIGLPTEYLKNRVFKVTMATLRRKLYEKVLAYHSWLPMPEVKPMTDISKTLIDRYPRGEAPLCIGSVLHNWRRGVCDGVVVASPWGCGPGLIAESLLRHQRQIPLLFVYSDGSPIDERRLNAFAFRLRRAPTRVISPSS